MTRSALMLIVFAAVAAGGLSLTTGTAQAAGAPAHASSHVPPDLYVPDGKGGFRRATAEEAIVATESPAAHDSGKTSFIDIKRYDLGIYTLLVFGTLYLFIQFKVWPHIATGLKKREANIQGARDEALKARQDAEDLRSRLQKDYADAHDKVRAMLDEARKDADRLRTVEREAGAKDAAAERERAKQEIAAAKEAAVQELYQQAVQLAATLSAKTIRRQLSAEDHRRLLDESLAELKNGVGKA